MPYALAALGSALSERGGVICIALEGIMLIGALAYTLGAYFTGNPWAGIGCALLAGVLTAWLHAEATVRFRADQITSGLGINLLAAGLTRFVLVHVFHSSSNSPRVPGLPELPLRRARERCPALGALLGLAARARDARAGGRWCSCCCSARCSACACARSASGPRPRRRWASR